MEPLSSSPDSRLPGGPVSLPYMQTNPTAVSDPSAAAAAVALTASATRPGVLGLQKKEGLPPSPPPRPGKTHHRSSSLDLAQLSRRAGGGGAVLPPFLPPRRPSPGRRPSGSGVGSVEELDSVPGRDIREISANIHKYKESVALLTRTVAELSQEVADIVEERVVLEYQLDQLKSFGSQD